MEQALTVLDAQAIVALLVGEPAAADVEAILRDQGDRSLISAANLAEVIDVLVRLKGRTLEEVTEKIDWLMAAGLAVVPVDEEIGRVAGRLHAALYDRTKRPLSLADCLALATAITLADAVATSDRPLAEAARTQECRVISLPDSAGRRP